MDKWNGKIALVTGASKGIGRLIVKILALHKMKVVACARNEDKLKLLQEEAKEGGGYVDTRKCDQSNMEDVVQLFKYIAETYGSVHVCVNNSVLAFPDYFLPKKSCKRTPEEFYQPDALFERMKLYQQWQTCLQVNVLSLSICCKEALNLMVCSGVKDGIIINISSSIVGKFVTLFTTKIDEKAEYFRHMYEATKWAVTATFQCIRLELAAKHPEASGIRIVTISPSWVKIDRLVKGDKADKSTQAALN